MRFAVVVVAVVVSIIEFGLDHVHEHHLRELQGASFAERLRALKAARHQQGVKCVSEAFSTSNNKFECPSTQIYRVKYKSASN